ncbi:MAG: glycosyltransferase family 2 protein [Chitinophagaceae bacterium]|uniref:glycosyltransferase family 2 protein n=1 Tax=unclassified Paraflavitalea TaxID=2798305 RepID=UPI003D330B96|nr:glycosyltransferase family 2 protein [Chitinophagaceae bacterium]
MLSVVIITFNEEKNIERCLASVKGWVDEIIVLDSFSTDATVSIATEMGAKISQQKFAGYIEQKNDALNLATGDWVLCLDADEAIDEQLKASILQAIQQEKVLAFKMNRCTNYCGKFIKHGSWYPDRKLRLFKRELGKWGGINPHDEIIMSNAEAPSLLQGAILHYSYNTLEEHIQQNNKFSTISALAYYNRGKKASWFKMIVNPCWAFLHGYIFKAGFLDGFEGYVIAKNVAHLTFLKYYKLYALHKGIPVK